MGILRYNDVNWNLPFLTGKNARFLDIFIENTLELGEPCPVKYASGKINNKWNTENHICLTTVKNFGVPKCVKERGVIPIFSFPSYHISDEAINDYEANSFLDLIININGEIELSSDKLYNHIKKRHPNAKLIASPVKSFYEMEQGKEVDYYKELSDKFDRVILDSAYVKRKLLNDIDKYEDTSKFEITVNDRCVINCPVKEQHLLAEEQNDKFHNCPMDTMSLKEKFDNSLSLSEDEINKILETSNITNLKITGNNLHKQDAKFLVLNYMLTKYGVSSFFMWTINEA